MATTRNKTAEQKEMTVEEKLKLLYALQIADSDIDKIKTLRGELPLEVQDLEDEIAGLNTRIHNYEQEIKNLQDEITNKKNEIKEAEALIKKYETHQMNVRNNREFDSLSKEIEYQTLEIELCNKRIKEFTKQIEEKKETIEKSQQQLEEREKDLAGKKEELNAIIADTQKEEEKLIEKSKDIGDLCNAFNKDLILWVDKLFFEGAPSIDFLDNSIISNANMISGFIKPIEEPDEEFMDDIFDF